MRERLTDSGSVDEAVQEILGLFAQDPMNTRVIYFDGWQGFGASTVLRAVADALRHGTTSPELHLDKVIQIDCSIWQSRRAMQRAIAVELELGHSVTETFDKMDEEDDFSGVDEGFRSEILSVAQNIYQALNNQRILVIFHNGNDTEVDLYRSGMFFDYSMLSTFRRRFRTRETYSQILNKVTNASVFIYGSWYGAITTEEILFQVLHREAVAIAASCPCMKRINTEEIIRCCMYALFIYLCTLDMEEINSKSMEYNLEARASNYLACDCITQGDRPWEISYALQEEIKWDLNPNLIKQVCRRFAEVFSNDDSIHYLTLKDMESTGQQQQYP